jgi:hypothetical protein
MPVTGPPEVPATFRALEDLVVSAVGPAVADPVVREHAACWHVAKRPNAVVLTLAAPPLAGEQLRAAVMRHLAPAAPGEEPAADADPLLHPLAAEYRQGLSDVTEIALDLHTGSRADLSSHQCMLLRAGCGTLDPRFLLHPYLSQHSRSYVERSAAPGAGRRWEWRHEEWWARCYTPGPGPDLQPPILSLGNIVLGLAPRRWDDPARLAARLGIRCP